MAYERTTLDAAALRKLAAATAERIFPATSPPRLPWWRAIFTGPPPRRQPRIRHLCERFNSGEIIKYPFTKVKEGPSLRLREDGVIEFAQYTLQQDHIVSYSDVREATDEELLLADYRWETEWSTGDERILNASRGKLVVDRKGAGLRKVLEGLR